MMAASLLSSITRLTPFINRPAVFNVLVEGSRTLYIQSCLFRAKKGTRERKLKLLKKRKAQKAALLLKQGPYVPYTKRKQTKDGETIQKRRISDDDREEIADNVWHADMFKFRVFSFEEAVKCVREVFHPSIYNLPNAPINAFIELDMSTDKRTKFYEGFANVVPVNYPFPQNDDRSILAFCKLREQMDDVTEAGATLAGGAEIIKQIKRGKIKLPDFQFVIAHPNIMSELISIRGLLRKKFPSIENGKLGVDLTQLVKDLRSGVKYEAKRDEFEMDYGYVDVAIGHVNMETAHLEDNFQKVIENIKTKGPKRKKNMDNYRFVTRCFITAPDHTEKFKIAVEEYLGEEEVVSSDDEDEEGTAGSSEQPAQA
ncbi:uncharacterized protein mRpL1 [Planococcus citri]|uniref:uncharacterized protein mRpL1 n=1 Tax=Planococcus citri TaxID=170843 RepID=UPI0031FA1157